jgi:hypothetical protein
MSKTEAVEAALRMLNEGYARGLIPEEAYIREDARLRARQSEIRAWRDEQGRGPASPSRMPAGGFSRPLGVHEPAASGSPSTAFLAGQGHLPFPRRPIRLDLPVRLIRRRGLAYGGMLPPAIAKTFTVGQAAVLSVISYEHLHHGACRKSYGELADEAGCSRRWVKLTIALAHRAGLLSVEHRPRPGRKDDTNVIRILDEAWLAWLRVRRERQKAGRKAATIGGSRVLPSPNSSRFKRGFEPKERPCTPSESPSRGCLRTAGAAADR